MKLVAGNWISDLVGSIGGDIWPAGRAPGATCNSGTRSLNHNDTVEDLMFYTEVWTSGYSRRDYVDITINNLYATK